MITKTIYDRLTEKIIPMRLIPIKKFSLVGAFSDRAQVIANRVQFSFLIENREFTHEFYVVKSLTYDMMLGIDFLNEYTATINCGRYFTMNFAEVGENDIKLNAIP